MKKSIVATIAAFVLGGTITPVNAIAPLVNEADEVVEESNATTETNETTETTVVYYMMPAPASEESEVAEEVAEEVAPTIIVVSQPSITVTIEAPEPIVVTNTVIVVSRESVAVDERLSLAARYEVPGIEDDDEEEEEEEDEDEEDEEEEEEDEDEDEEDEEEEEEEDDETSVISASSVTIDEDEDEEDEDEEESSVISASSIVTTEEGEDELGSAWSLEDEYSYEEDFCDDDFFYDGFWGTVDETYYPDDEDDEDSVVTATSITMNTMEWSGSICY